eukprot:13604687-Alexandrium_andersonii.AAC.1
MCIRDRPGAIASRLDSLIGPLRADRHEDPLARAPGGAGRERSVSGKGCGGLPRAVRARSSPRP